VDTICEPGSSVSLTTGWTTGRSRFDPRQGQRIFPLTSLSRPTLRPTKPPVQWVPGPSPRVKRVWGITLTTHPHLIPRSGICRIYISSPPKRLHDVYWDSFSFLGHTFYNMSSSRLCIVFLTRVVLFVTDARHDGWILMGWQPVNSRRILKWLPSTTVN
jgi:hypothetical protein